MPAICVWRNDLEVRFENAPSSLKCHYPELLSGSDALQLALDGLWGEGIRARHRALKMFIADQFTKDEKVKFRQIDLSNSLFDLFVDVPLALSVHPDPDMGSELVDPLPYPRSSRSRAPSAFLRIVKDHFAKTDNINDLGTAGTLLSLGAEQSPTPVTVYGAPGQGKSTIGQYVCQVHRLLYLAKNDYLKLVPAEHLQTTLRIPFKVDLRDFSSYLLGVSPFEANASVDPNPTLEGFLAKLVTHHSGGMKFTPDDVAAVLESSPAFLFFDGLDEVAEPEARRKAIYAIQSGLVRIRSAESADLQVVVTTRPSMFGEVTELRDSFPLSLGSLSQNRIKEYAQKWVKARALDDADAEEVQRVLRDKVEIPHIRELARNPMQLAILLSLIQNIGRSLPDRRTDLYQRYLEIFMNRESEKSIAVRDNRVLLLDFVAYLAWFLQCQSETSHRSGAITSDDLVELVTNYLKRTGHDVVLANVIFHGGLDRIFVLVQRIEGLYEFEVQPLREFFCAKHLFESAPEGTRRDPSVCGDHAQRFEAIAANPFWMNVTRFYAGFYARGLLGSLVTSIEEMLGLDQPPIALQARRVAYALLADSVFQGKPPLQIRLIKSALDSLACDVLPVLNGREDAAIRLPSDCGRELLAESVFGRLVTLGRSLRATLYCSIIRSNGGSDLQGDFLTLVQAHFGAERTMWVDRMARSGALSTEGALQALDPEDACDPLELGRRYSSCLRYAAPALEGTLHWDRALKSVLEGTVDCMSGATPLAVLATFISTPESLMYGFSRGFRASISEDPAGPCEVFLSALDQVRETEDSHEMGMWRTYASVIDAGVQVFGERWCFLSAAVRAAGAPASISKVAGDSLFDHSISLAQRTRKARLRRGNGRAWEKDLDQAADKESHMFWAAMVGAWTSPSSFDQLRPLMADILESLSDFDYIRVLRAVDWSVRAGNERSDRKREARRVERIECRLDLLEAIGFRFTLLPVSSTCPDSLAVIADKYLRGMERQRLADSDPGWVAGIDSRADWARAIEPMEHHAIRPLDRTGPDATLAGKALRQHTELPLSMVQESAAAVMSHYRATRVADIARDQQWELE